MHSPHFLSNQTSNNKKKKPRSTWLNSNKKRGGGFEAQIGLSDQASSRDTVMAATNGCLKRPSGLPRQRKRILSTTPDSSTLLNSIQPSSPPLYIERERESQKKKKEERKRNSFLFDNS